MSETNQQQTFTGGCLCGNIRYTVTGNPIAPLVCSCAHCKKLSGGPMTAWVGFLLQGFSWDGPGGEPTWFATWPGVNRGFCPQCGARICALDDGASAVFVTIMSLDDHSVVVPEVQRFPEDAVSWLPQVPVGDRATAV
ncbi:GFA family protein [Streptomyces sp. KK5PA1]|uniref:GFA family protein n=2 Tax=Actinacidiphila acididurans TaxID=2784346 RepID=A0ABS2U3F8_9ACTN|nr:GFA family protein [Actinacidiphila acididurans]